MPKRRVFWLLSLLPVLSLLAAVTWEWNAVVYVPKPSTAETISLSSVDYTDWTDLLGRYVDDQGRVAYRAWKSQPQDMDRLDHFLQTMGQVRWEGNAPPAEQIPFWINLYNALTIKGILREYPTPSILQHVRPIGYHIWKDLRVWADGRYISLDGIEHDVLRPMKEPRIHFAIVCASAGCPRLRQEAYTPNRLEEQLEDSARDFFARPDSFQVSKGGQGVKLSSILKWFGKDFGATPAQLLRAIAPYVSAEDARILQQEPPPAIEFLPYDWSLNDRS